MVIRKMNTVLVKHNKILFGIFSAVIIISFVWFFTPGLDGSLFFGKDYSSPNAVVGNIFGKKITNKEYQASFRKRMLLLTAMTGRDAAPFQEYIQRTLFNEIAKEEAAAMLGITATDQELENFLRNGFALFRSTKGFDAELYRKFADGLQEREGITIAEFEELVRRMIGAEKLSTLLLSDNFTADEVRNLAIFQKEKFNAQLIEFPFSAFRNVKKVTDEDALNFYKANPKMFMTAPLLKVQAVKFPYTVSKKVPTLKDVQAYYNANKKEFTVKGKVQSLSQVKNRIAKILQQKMGREEAIEKAKAFRNAIYDAAGDSADSGKAQIALFRQIAAKKRLAIISSDLFSASASTIKGIGNEPELVALLFKEANVEHHPLLRSSFAGKNAAYVVAAVASVPSKLAEFKDVKAAAKAAVIVNNSKLAAQEAAATFMHKVIALKDKGAAQLTVLAKRSGGKVTAMNGFTRDSQEVLPVKRQAMQLAFNLKDNTLSNVEKTSDSVMLVYLIGRKAPAEKEIQAAVKELNGMMGSFKQNMQQNTLGLWLQANIKQAFAGEDQGK